MKITKITFENFLAYKDQTLTFDPKDDGVYVFVGQNSKGKSALYRGINYLLFGEAYSKGNKLSPSRLVNLDSIKEGNCNAKITMKYIDNTDMEVEVIRTIEYKGKNNQKASELKDSDFKETLAIIRNNVSLNKTISEIILNSSFPKDLKDYYLIDGEEVSNWEQIIDNALTEGADEATKLRLKNKVKESIENVLELPFINSAVNILNAVNEKISLEKEKELKAEGKNESILNEIEEITKRIKKTEDDNLEHKNNLEIAKEEKDGLQSILSKNKELEELFTNRENDKTDLEDAIQEQEDFDDDLHKETNNLWQTLAGSLSKKKYNELNKKLKKLAKEKERFFEVNSQINNLKKMIVEEVCSTCGHSLNADDIKKYQSTKEELEKIKLNDPTDQINDLNRKIEILKPFINDSIPSAVRLNTAVNNSQSNIIRINKFQEKIKKWDEQIGSSASSKEDLQKKRQRYTELEGICANLGQAIKSNEGKIQPDIQKRIDLRKGIKEIKTNKKLEDKLVTAELIKNLYERTQEVYTSESREKLEEYATKIFREISHTYKKLEIGINNSFFLELDNEVIPDTSTGLGKIIAISLIASLHQYVRNDIPIVFDSILTSIDDEHTKNLMEFIPTFSNQTFLTVFPGETNVEELLSNLGSKAINVWEIKNDTGTDAEFKLYVNKK